MLYLRLSVLLFLVGCGEIKLKQDAKPADDADAGCAAVEDCFNGVDDDCNGHTDCDDAACTGGATPIAECIPDPGSAPAGTLETGACPPAYPDATQISYELSAGTCAAGTCSCDPTPIGGARCDAFLERNGANQVSCTAIGTAIFSGLNAGNGCFPLNAALTGGYHTLSTRLIAACAAPGPGGTSTKVAPTWRDSNNFCSRGGSGGGCATGQVCMPKAARYCVLETGDQIACTRPGYSVQDTTQWYTGFDDSARTCSCDCKPTGTCGPVLFGVGNCNVAVSNGCKTGFTGYDRAEAPVPSGAACAAAGTSTGSTSTAGFERTVCCTN